MSDELVAPSLARLAGAFVPWPVRPSALIERLRDGDGPERFAALARALYPDDPPAPLDAPPGPGESVVAAALRQFAARFQADYFPLEPVWERGAGFERFMARVPFARMALAEEDLHAIPREPPGSRLLFGAIAPFIARRVGAGVLRDSLRGLVPPEVWVDVPGRPPAGDFELWAARLRRTRYLAVVLFVRWCAAETQNPFLDRPRGWDGGYAWHPDTVRRLREDYRAALALRRRVEAFRAWLAADPAARFRATVRALYGEESVNDEPDREPEHRPHAGQRALPLGRAAR